MNTLKTELLNTKPLPVAVNGWLNVADFGASGSKFETTATTTAGLNQIVVKNVGDFKVGQGVIVSRCNIRIVSPLLRGPENGYDQKPLGNALEIRGYDGSTGSWLVFILEIDSAKPLSFRWSDNLVREDKWQGVKVPITWNWQKLSNGIDVKFNKRDLELGHMITFSAHDQLLTVIEKIAGKTFTLRAAANRTATDAFVRHDDSLAIQATVDCAIREKRNVFFPSGWYRVPNGIRMNAAEALCLEGANGVDTVMDISDGAASIFGIHNCKEITIRNFRMVGHTGMAEAAGAFRLSHDRSSFWASELKPCKAIGLTGTERALVENVHASRMASECFYAWGTWRKSTAAQTGLATEPYHGEEKQYQKSLIYLRCSVTDCAANAFNNNDMGENTSVLYCRIENAGPGGWHAAEMPARFLKLIGNYVRNAGPFTIGDMSHRYDDLHNLGCGQAIVADNVFEGIGKCGGIVVHHGSSQVVIANNLFINYNGSAITASSYHWGCPALPSKTVTITGNIIDMTHPGDTPIARTGITVSVSNAIVADNQIYVRGRHDPLVTGIMVAEPALNVIIHNNLIRNCQQGLITNRVQSSVREVIDTRTFSDTGPTLPTEWKDSHLYRGWNLAWISGSQPGTLSVIDTFEPETLRFRLKEPRAMKAGDTFHLFPSGPANWSLHHNTVTGCSEPVKLEAYGSETSVFRDNVISRNDAQGVKQAISVTGQFKIIGNQFSGFDEPGCAALSLAPDPTGRVNRNIFQGNIFERCTSVVSEAGKELWKGYVADGNLFVNCKEAPTTGGRVSG
ncbi:MAG: right-handed parallel beta-helix repeat-containing protein [Candidatus Omnitrophota bacterium]